MCLPVPLSVHRRFLCGVTGPHMNLFKLVHLGLLLGPVSKRVVDFILKDFLVLVVSGRNTDLRDIHPLDLHTAIYLCADDFLRQVLITHIDSIDSNVLNQKNNHLPMKVV